MFMRVRDAMASRVVSLVLLLIPLVKSIRVSPGAELPVWAVSFNLGILDEHIKVDETAKRCQLLFPTDAVVEDSTFQVLTLQWETEGFWFAIK